MSGAVGLRSITHEGILVKLLKLFDFQFLPKVGIKDFGATTPLPKDFDEDNMR